MSRKVELSGEILDALGPEPERAVPEAVLLLLVFEGKMSVARAGELLGLDRRLAIHWYTSHGFYYLDLSREDAADELRHAERDAPPDAPPERRTTGYEVTNYYDPGTGEVRSGAPDFLGDRRGVEPKEGCPVPERRAERLEALATEVRKVVENSGWRERNLYWPEGMHLVETRLRQLDRHAAGEEAQEERAKRRYGALFGEVAAVLYRHDPAGLAAAGAPKDEYEPEASTILPRLEHTSSGREALWVVRDEFSRWFSPDVAGTAERYEEAASEIWRLWSDAAGHEQPAE